MCGYACISCLKSSSESNYFLSPEWYRLCLVPLASESSSSEFRDLESLNEASTLVSYDLDAPTCLLASLSLYFVWASASNLI